MLQNVFIVVTGLITSKALGHPTIITLLDTSPLSLVSYIKSEEREGMQIPFNKQPND